MEYVIYADESDKHGPYFANFYGGLLVRSPDLEPVQLALREAKERLHFGGRVKWQKVTTQYLDKYVSFVDVLFDLIEADKVKMRVMFTQRMHVPVAVTPEQRRLEYFLLYYQFLKHAFGLRYSDDGAAGEPVRTRFYLDRHTGTIEQKERFKGYISSLESWPAFRQARILVPRDQIAEVGIDDHILLQCVDLVLGAMQYRLNDRHKQKPEGSRRRAARTIAKEKLYKAIHARIVGLHPHFNIGITTGSPNGDRSWRWRQPYRHWLFVPKTWVIDKRRVKPKKR